ncbi:MAG: YbaB/EbfC family nucleoid-associated protein [Mycobacterium sp.]|nr:YbaB/EbfC family nucleoid-associated protein [Mycobacterium sp.]
MVDLQAWERRVQQRVDEVHRNGQRLADRVAKVRGRGAVSGIRVELNASGDITDLQIAPGAMGWSSAQLTDALLRCHRQARAQVNKKVDSLVGTADPQIREQIDQTRSGRSDSGGERPPMTEEEIQAADDAYFAQRNQYGGWTNS